MITWPYLQCQRSKCERHCHASAEKTEPAACTAWGSTFLKVVQLVLFKWHRGACMSLVTHKELGQHMAWHNAVPSVVPWHFSSAPRCCTLPSLREHHLLVPVRPCAAGMTKQELGRQTHFMKCNYRAEQICVRGTQQNIARKGLL